MPTAVETLTEFGFTGLEAEIYAFLLRESPASGYRIAQAIRKPAANTYKALETLDQKGAILSEEGEKRRYKPVPIDELLARWHRERTAKAATLLAELENSAEPVPDPRIYSFHSSALAIGRAQALLQAASKEVLLLADASALDALMEDGQAAVLRGVNLIYAVSGDGVRLVVDGQRSLVGSGREFFYTENAVFTAECARGLRASLALHQISQMLEAGAGGKRISRYLATYETQLSGDA